MRAILIGAVLTAMFGLTACGEEEVAAPPPKKSLARQAVFYQGQEQVVSISTASIAPSETPGTLHLKVDGVVASGGYTDLGFEPRIYAGPPPDGIYEVDVVGTKPAAATAATPTPIHIEGAWPRYNTARLKGVKFITQTNEMTAMLPATPPAEAPK
jgi:hypothetical protein